MGSAFDTHPHTHTHTRTHTDTHTHTQTYTNRPPKHFRNPKIKYFSTISVCFLSVLTTGSDLGKEEKNDRAKERGRENADKQCEPDRALIDHSFRKEERREGREIGRAHV